MHFGPHALLVREIFFDPDAVGSHDYLGCPEIIQDIAGCYAAEYGGTLEHDFRAASRPCIVKFHSTTVDDYALTSAFWYLDSRLRGRPLSTLVTWSGFVGRGVPVLPSQIASVEVMTTAASASSGTDAGHHGGAATRRLARLEP
jgi:hypothetical protein